MSDSEPYALDAVFKSVRSISGPRPTFMSDPDVDKLIDMVMALTAELVVTRDRLDSVERVLEEKDILNLKEVEAPELNERQDVVNDRLAANDALIARVLRVVHQDIRRMEEQRADSVSQAAE